jgi:hypothetical protein
MRRFQRVVVVGVESAAFQVAQQASRFTLPAKRTGEHTGCCHRRLKTSFVDLAVHMGTRPENQREEINNVQEKHKTYLGSQLFGLLVCISAFHR